KTSIKNIPNQLVRFPSTKPLFAN
ncbi:hypothetical protein CWATWH0003_2663b4, partial [Crocosphaera watsonii WH 0003]